MQSDENLLAKKQTRKQEKTELVTALENVDNKPVFEMNLKENLNLRDFVFTFLSFATSKKEYKYLWDSIDKDFTKDSVFILRTSNDVRKDKFFCKNDLFLHYRFFLHDHKNKVSE